MKTLLTRMAIGALSASMLLLMASCGDSSGSTPGFPLGWFFEGGQQQR